LNDFNFSKKGKMEVENFRVEPNEFYRRTDASLLRRGYSVQENQPSDLFTALSCRRRSIDRSGSMARPVASMNSSREAMANINSNEDDDQENMDISFEEEIEPPMSQTRRATISSGTLGGNILRKRPSNIRDWPLGEPKVRNSEDYYELELNIGSFKPEEVSAKIMGKELIIHCKPDSDRSVMEGFPKEIFRCYSLPLSMAPTATDVSIVKDDHWLKLAVKKESALRSPIGLFIQEITEILEEEQPIDVEEAELL
jgi:hypothetical protein